MSSTVFFIDSGYSNHLVASRLIKHFALDGLNYPKLTTSISNDIVLFAKSNLIGLTNQIIEEFVEKKGQREILIGVLDSEPCVICLNASILDILFPDITSLYDNIKKEWAHCDLPQDKLQVLNNNSKVISFTKDVQNKLRKEAIEMGVQLQDPNSTYLSYDTEFGRDVLIEPNVYFGPKVKVHDNVHIKAFSYLEGVEIENGVEIGPFARIRANSKIGNNSKVGNFVEIKSTTLGVNTKVSHLSYLGDAKIGNNVNIGAGVITCNYDGSKKYNTIINDDSFVGSNSTIIAPIAIGIHSFIGAGSFINKNVPDNTFAIGRSKQCMKLNRRK